MSILSVNAGSSSLKFALYPVIASSVKVSEAEMTGNIEGLEPSGNPTISWEIKGQQKTTDVVVETGTTDDASAKDILNSDWFQLIVGSIGFFIILCILNGIFGLFEHKAEMSESDIGKGGAISFLSFFKPK